MPLHNANGPIPFGQDYLHEGNEIAYQSLLTMTSEERETWGVHWVEPEPEPEPEPPTLAQRRLARLDQLAERRKLATRDFSFGPFSIDLDKDTEDAISKCKQGLEALAAQGVENPYIDFEISRGVFTIMDLPTVGAISLAAFAHVQECFSNVRSLSEAILASETPEAINIDLGWP